jgi:hypothetical protein
MLELRIVLEFNFVILVGFLEFGGHNGDKRGEKEH